jgi:hypothetical protein
MTSRTANRVSLRRGVTSEDSRCAAAMKEKNGEDVRMAPCAAAQRCAAAPASQVVADSRVVIIRHVWACWQRPPKALHRGPARADMNAFVTRPRVADLVFQLYGRPLHPELFDILAMRRLEREDYELRVWITRTGHVITWENADVLLTEATAAEAPFSEARRLLHFKMRGEHAATLPSCHGVVYQTSFQVETLAPEIFLHVHQEIVADSAKRGFLHNFQPHHRLALGPLSHVIVEGRPQCLLVSTFHTFPDEYTIIKSQTLIERRH